MTILISKVNQLGDNIVFLPVVQHLRRVLPEARLVVVTSPVVREVYERCVPEATLLTVPTQTFNSAWKRPWKLIELLAKFRAERPDAVLLGDDQGNVAHLLAAASGAKCVVAPENPRLPANRLAGHRVPIDLTRLVAQQNWKLLSALGGHLEFAVPTEPPSPDLSAMIDSNGTAYDVVIHAGASREYKRWPMDRYVALANQLAQGGKVAWITQGHEEEAKLSGGIVQVKPGSLSQLVTLLAKARLFVGNNSGPMNIASAVGTAGLIFNGPSMPTWDPAWRRERFVLLQDPTVKCQPCDAFTHPVNVCGNVLHPMQCMNVWTVERVMREATRMLNG